MSGVHPRPEPRAVGAEGALCPGAVMLMRDPGVAAAADRVACLIRCMTVTGWMHRLTQ
jgi:hypothetical protein